MTKNLLIAVSSKTGNTRIIGRALADEIEGAAYVEAAEAPADLSAYGDVALCFWCDRGMAPEDTQRLARRLSGRRIACFATMGGNPDDAKSREWMKKTSEALVASGENNTLAGMFLCRGRIDPALFERMTAMAGGTVSPEREARRRERETHPDRMDVVRAVAACRAAFGGEN